MSKSETLERAFVLAGFDAVRAVGGDALVQILLSQAGTEDLAEGTERVPLERYLRYRDVAVDFLGAGFCATAFETGRLLVRSLPPEKARDVEKLLDQFARAASKLPAIGQAAVLAAKDAPGVVRATMKDPKTLLITIDACPECRGLTRETPFCYLNQGVITEFAERHLGLAVGTRETRCMATGDPRCEIEVVEVMAT